MPHGGAVRHAGFAGCHRRGAVVLNSLQDSGYPADQPVSVQDGVQISPLAELVRPLFAVWEPMRRVSVTHRGVTPDSRIATLGFVSSPAPGLDRPSLIARYHMGKGIISVTQR